MIACFLDGKSSYLTLVGWDWVEFRNMRIREGSVVTRRSARRVPLALFVSKRECVGRMAMLARLASVASGRAYNVWTTIWDTPYSLVRERYAPGCFKASLASDIDVMCCRDHKRDDILGRVSNDTLELSEDGEGLCSTCG